MRIQESEHGVTLSAELTKPFFVPILRREELGEVSRNGEVRVYGCLTVE